MTFRSRPFARPDRDLVSFGSFPRGAGQIGVAVCIPSARYMLALKLKALRLDDPAKGRQEFDDVAKLLRTTDINDVEAAISALAEFFPISAAGANKQRFALKYILSAEGPTDAPCYPGTGI